MSYSIDTINLICSDMSAPANHKYEIDGLNAICVALGGVGKWDYHKSALNEICALMGKTATFKYTIDSLNALAGSVSKYEDEAWEKVQLSAGLSPWLDWMSTPFWAIPDSGIVLTVGIETTIYGDSLISVPIDNDLHVTYTCIIGVQSGNNFIVTPSTEGVFPITITFKNGNRVFETKTVNLTAIAKMQIGAISILEIGDSTIDGDLEEIGTATDALLDNSAITYVGTRGTTRKHTSIAGYSWNMFARNVEAPSLPSPFFKAGVLDIASYFTDNSLSAPDVVYFKLGINDIFGNTLLSDAQINTILGYADLLINAFLSYNANYKLNVALSTICTSSQTIWDASYPVYFSPNYIRNMHKYWLAVTTKYANGAFNGRVGVSYEAIGVNRATGYANGVHHNSTGNAMIGRGFAPYLNKMIAEKVIPSGVTVAWVDDYANINFTDNSGGAATHEIYASKNGGPYSLIATLSAGVTNYHDSTDQNASINYKVRAKYGAWLSGYSSVKNIVTPLVFKSNQSTLTILKIKTFNITAGKTVNIDYGDGNNTNYTGDNINSAIIHNYSATANPYFVKLSGDVDFITQLNITGEPKSYGDLSKWILPTSLNLFYLNTSAFTGNPFQRMPIGLTTINTDATPLSGDLSGLTWPVGITRFYAEENDFTKLPRGNYKDFDGSIGLWLNMNNCLSAEVDSILVDMQNYYSSVTPIKSQRFNLGGTGMGIPTSTGLAAKTAIQNIFVAAGFVANITVNA